MVGVSSVTCVSCGHMGPGTQISAATILKLYSLIFARGPAECLSSHVSEIPFTPGKGDNNIYSVIFQ